MNNLRVWFHETPVGSLSMNDDGRWGFQYESSWIAGRLFAVSPHLPMQNVLAPDLAHQRTVEWFFDNLLPEGSLRNKLATQEHLLKEDTWGLLSRYGRESAGALSVLPDNAKPSSKATLIPLSLNELEEMIQQSKAGIPLMAAHGVPRMSLPGTQEKLTVRKTQDGKLFLPEGAAASTHILKPENVNPEYPFCPANEWVSMELARRIGLSVPKAELLSLPNGERVYCVERYDRSSQGVVDGFVERIHQVDLCQACNVSPQKKYESYGGLETTDIFSAASLCVVAAQGTRTAMQWLAFNYLIGNDDAHAKNMSFFMRTAKLNPAPFYDLLCVETYHGRNVLAMSIGGEIKAGFIEGCHWDAMALESGHDPRALRLIIKNLTTKIEKVLPDICNAPELLQSEKDFVNDRIIPVIQQRLLFIKEATLQPALNVKTLSDYTDRLSPQVLQRITDQIEAKEARVH